MGIPNITTEVNNSSLKMVLERDFFEELYSDTWLKQITVAIFFLGAIGGLILEFGIIWYERHGDHPYRTLINQLFSTLSWLVVSYIFFVYIPDGTRYLIGPLDDTFCDVHNFLKNFISNCILLTLDGIIMLRYIFIFKVSNFAVINDDLLTRFLQIAILTLGFWMAGVKRMSVGRMPLNYYMCTGRDPSTEYGKAVSAKSVRKFDTFGLLVVTSLVTNVVALARIFLYQRTVEKSTQKIELGRIQQLAPNNQERNEDRPNNEEPKIRNMPKSMADLRTQILCLLINLFSVIVNSILAKIEPSELNDYGNRWLTYYIQIIGVAVAILGISIQYYIKHTSSIKAIVRNFREY